MELKDKAAHLAFAATLGIKATKEALEPRDLMDKLEKMDKKASQESTENPAVMEYLDCLACLDRLDQEAPLVQKAKEEMKESKGHKVRLGRKETRECPERKDNTVFPDHRDIKD